MKCLVCYLKYCLIPIWLDVEYDREYVGTRSKNSKKLG